MTGYDLHTITGQLHSQTHLIISIIIIMIIIVIVIVIVITIYLIIAIILHDYNDHRRRRHHLPMPDLTSWL